MNNTSYLYILWRSEVFDHGQNLPCVSWLYINTFSTFNMLFAQFISKVSDISIHVLCMQYLRIRNCLLD